jgi:hypothetical protein
VRQVQPGEAFRLPIDLSIPGEGTEAPLALRVDLTEKTQTFRLPVGREPREVQLDPQQWLLTDAVRFGKR